MYNMTFLMDDYLPYLACIYKWFEMINRYKKFLKIKITNGYVIIIKSKVLHKRQQSYKKLLSHHKIVENKLK